MKKIILILLVILFSYLLQAQTPDWEWVTQAGGFDVDYSWKICNDNYGNVYVTGHFYDTASFGSFTLSSYGLGEIFVAKLDANGNWLWAISAGGSDDDRGYAISTDSFCNVYVTGCFQSLTANFGQFNLTNTSTGHKEIFIAKIDSGGNWLWAESAGGVSEDCGFAISSDPNGNIYVTGLYGGIASFGSFNLDNVGPYNNFTDIFVTKLDANGNWLWAKSAGGSHYDEGYGISTDNVGNVFVTGIIRETAFLGSIALTSYGEWDIFAAKLDTDGNWLWAKNAGGNLNDIGNNICNDAVGNVYLTGSLQDSTNFGSFTLISDGGWDIFVAKLDTFGNWLWAESAGGASGWDIGRAISTCSNGNIYLTGCFSGTANFGPFTLISDGGKDIFAAKLEANSNWLWAKSAGGNLDDWGYGICTDTTGNLYVTGSFQDIASFDFFNITSSGESDVFVVKLSDTVIDVSNNAIPNTELIVNYPNPFNPSTTISFSIQDNCEVDISIYNVKGQIIRTIANDEFTKGNHSIVWNGDDESGKSVSSGIYYYELKVNGKTEAVKKCILLK